MTNEAILRKIAYQQGQHKLLSLRLILHKLDVIDMNDSNQDWTSWIMKYRV